MIFFFFAFFKKGQGDGEQLDQQGMGDSEQHGVLGGKRFFSF